MFQKSTYRGVQILDIRNKGLVVKKQLHPNSLKNLVTYYICIINKYIYQY